MKNLYKVTTSYDGSQNWASYYIAAENGTVAASVINIKIFKKRNKKRHEVVEEVEFIAPIEHTDQDLIPKKK